MKSVTTPDNQFVNYIYLDMTGLMIQNIKLCSKKNMATNLEFL